MSITEEFIELNGIMFKIERNGSIVNELKGLQESNSKNEKYLKFFAGSDVKPGDWAINLTGERLYITDTFTDFAFGEPSALKCMFQTQFEYNSKSEPQSTVFNIGTANNSIIGNQSHFTVNLTISLQEARRQIDSSDSNDKEELHRIIDLLESVANNQVPLSRGMLSGFSALMQRNSWIVSPLASLALNLLTTQIH